MIDPMIPGSAVATFSDNLPSSLARAFNFLLNHSLTLFGFFGGVDEPPELPPVNEVTMVEMVSPKAVKIAVMENLCSLKTSLIFSRRLKSSSKIFSTVCRMRASSLRF